MKSDLVGSLFGSLERPSGSAAGLVALGLDTTPFSGGTIDLSHTQFTDGMIPFPPRPVPWGTVDFSDAGFSGGVVYFGDAQFTDGTVDFSKASDWSITPTFPWTGTPPLGVKLPHDDSRGSLVCMAVSGSLLARVFLNVETGYRLVHCLEAGRPVLGKRVAIDVLSGLDPAVTHLVGYLHVSRATDASGGAGGFRVWSTPRGDRFSNIDEKIACFPGACC